MTDFIICLGYRGYMIKEYFANYVMHESDLTVDARTSEITYHTNYAEPWRVTLVDTGSDTMTGGRLKRVSRYLDPDESFCMTYGDGVADVDIGALIAFHGRHGKLATVTVPEPSSRPGPVERMSRNVPTPADWVLAVIVPCTRSIAFVLASMRKKPRLVVRRNSPVAGSTSSALTYGGF